MDQKFLHRCAQGHKHDVRLQISDLLKDFILILYISVRESCQLNPRVLPLDSADKRFQNALLRAKQVNRPVLPIRIS